MPTYKPASAAQRVVMLDPTESRWNTADKNKKEKKQILIQKGQCPKEFQLLPLVVFSFLLNVAHKISANADR